ncbi:MAG: tyrosine--tRNA ligase, partial [Candidatus Saccharimonadales bacterium]
MPEVTADEALITELISRGVSEIYPSAEALAEVLHSGKRLTVYMGIDPTAADMHVGHESQLLKLRRLQDLGHRVVLLIGDFTATIGDPTDKSAARVKLTREQVLDNARSYKQQAAKILDFDQQQNPVELRFNSEWLAKMGFADVLELASEFTVQQMLERDMFKKRMADNKPVGLHEFLYPIMQGWDSVCMDVDIEVGGSDQIFNMLVGSTLVKRHKGHQKFVIAGDLLVDPSGKKIGKTEGNMITLTDTPLDMFHKIMMWGDGITPHALELCSTLPMDEVNKIADELKTGKMSGLDGKLFLAKTIVTDLHGSDAAATAQAAYHSLTDKDKDLDKASFIKATVQT